MALDLRLDGREFDSRPPRLVLGWVTVFGRENHLDISPKPHRLNQPPIYTLRRTGNKYWQSSVMLCGSGVKASLSPSKCIVLHVAPADKCSDCFSYCIDNHTLSVVKSVTDLGVTYDTKLKFDLHIDKIYAKASSRAKLILKCFNTRSAAVLLKAFCACSTHTRVCICHMQPVLQTRH